MRLTPILPGFLCVAVLAAAALPARAAAIMQYTYQGVVAEGFDSTGVFGAAGRDLAGLSFTAVFLRQDKPGATVESDASSSAIYGSDADNPVSGWLAIDGGPQWSFGVSSGFQGVGRGCDVVCSDVFNHGATTFIEMLAGTSRYSQNDFLTVFGEAAFASLASLDYHDLPAFGPGDAVTFSGDFQVHSETSDSSNSSMEILASARGRLVPHSLAVSPYGEGGAVPEPAAWALMILGFGAAGAMLRAHRKAWIAAA